MESRGQDPQRTLTITRAADGSIPVPSVADAGSSSSGSPGTPRRAAECLRTHEREYVQAVLEYYLWLPGTASVISRHDRRCARMLFAQGVPLDLVKSAMAVAVARRTFRTGAPVPRVRALHFFVPVIDELLETPVEPGYVQYLEGKLRPLAAEKVPDPRSVSKALTEGETNKFRKSGRRKFSVREPSSGGR